MPLVFLVLALPLVEIGLFIWVGGIIGLLPTLFAVIFSAVLGLYLLRAMGTNMLVALRAAVAGGASPGTAAAEHGLLMAAAALFIVPGFLSDAVALALLPLPVRAWVVRWFAKQAVTHGQGSGPAHSAILEAEYEIVDAPVAAGPEGAVQRER